MAAVAVVSASAASESTSTVPSLPPPCPKSPPKYPDLYGKRRGLAKVQMLEREIGFLEEELKSTQLLHPSSRCCKEVTDFVAANADPLVPTYNRSRRSRRFWKWLKCLNFSWVCCCCYSGCTIGNDMECCACNVCGCLKCRRPRWRCCAIKGCFRCTNPFSCKFSCCSFRCPSCTEFCCCRITFKCPKCPEVRCSRCTANCRCTHCCLFF